MTKLTKQIISHEIDRVLALSTRGTLQHPSRPNKNARRRANKHYARVRKDLSTCTCALYGYETCPTCSR